MRFLTRRQIQEEELRILLFFDGFCSEYGLRYSLDSGTMLGAVRHKGFIPWDDDVDVSMPRPDYDRLLKMESCLPDDFQIITSRNSPFASSFAKLQYRKIRAQEPEYIGRMDEYLWIDIFPMDGAHESVDERERAQAAMNDLIRKRLLVSIDPMSSTQAFWRRLIKVPYCGVLKLLYDASDLDDAIEALSREVDYETASEVTCLFSGIKRGWSVDRGQYETVEKMSFEGIDLPVMGCWKDYLAKIYGDYMQLPPEEDRHDHRLTAWYV